MRLSNFAFQFVITFALSAFVGVTLVTFSAFLSQGVVA